MSELSSADIGAFHRECEDLARSISNATLVDQRSLLQQLITRIDLHREEILFKINQIGLLRLIGATGKRLPEEHLASGSILLCLPFTVRRRGAEAKIVLGGNNHKPGVVDMALVGLIAKAHRWLDLVTTGSVSTLEGLAKAEYADPTDVSRILPLAFLAPDFVQTIVEGRHSIRLTLMRLKRLSHLPHDWTEQHKALDMDFQSAGTV